MYYRRTGGVDSELADAVRFPTIRDMVLCPEQRDEENPACSGLQDIKPVPGDGLLAALIAEPTRAGPQPAHSRPATVTARRASVT